MDFLRRLFVVLLFAVVPLFAGLDIAEYQAYVDSLLPEVSFGLSVRSVGSGVELANINGNELFTPASTMKTLSTATALHFLPLDYAPETKFSLMGAQQGNVFKGTLNVSPLSKHSSTEYLGASM